MKLKNKINQLVEKYFDEVVTIRRHIHENPELSFQEYETSKFITSILDSWNIKYKSGIAITGIVCIIEGRNPGKKIIALRADIDALPVMRKTTHCINLRTSGLCTHADMMLIRHHY
jgi:hippurate hydrolase